MKSMCKTYISGWKCAQNLDNEYTMHEHLKLFFRDGPGLSRVHTCFYLDIDISNIDLMEFGKYKDKKTFKWVRNYDPTYT